MTFCKQFIWKANKQIINVFTQVSIINKGVKRIDLLIISRIVASQEWIINPIKNLILIKNCRLITIPIKIWHQTLFKPCLHQEGQIANNIPKIGFFVQKVQLTNSSQILKEILIQKRMLVKYLGLIILIKTIVIETLAVALNARISFLWITNQSKKSINISMKDSNKVQLDWRK